MNGQGAKEGEDDSWDNRQTPTSTDHAKVNKKGKKGKRSVSKSNTTGTVFASVSKKDKKSKKNRRVFCTR